MSGGRYVKIIMSRVGYITRTYYDALLYVLQTFSKPVPKPFKTLLRESPTFFATSRMKSCSTLESKIAVASSVKLLRCSAESAATASSGNAFATSFATVRAFVRKVFRLAARFPSLWILIVDAVLKRRDSMTNNKRAY